MKGRASALVHRRLLLVRVTGSRYFLVIGFELISSYRRSADALPARDSRYGSGMSSLQHPSGSRRSLRSRSSVRSLNLLMTGPNARTFLLCRASLPAPRTAHGWIGSCEDRCYQRGHLCPGDESRVVTHQRRCHVLVISFALLLTRIDMPEDPSKS
jgi:hypothetical protein